MESGMDVVVLDLLLSPSQGVQMPLHTSLEGNKQDPSQAGSKVGASLRILMLQFF